MARFDLNKGGRFSIEKGVQRVLIGLGWDAGDNFDLDASAFGLVNINGNPRFYADGSHAVCYANKDLKKPTGEFITDDGSIKHLGDNRTGVGEGDDEKIELNFFKLPTEITEISIFVTIHEAVKRGQDYGQVKNSYVRVVDQDTEAELCKYALRDEFAGASAVQVGSFLKENDQWVFHAVGAGSKADLGAILNQYS
jgi:tellurium resistance protein TerD